MPPSGQQTFRETQPSFHHSSMTAGCASARRLLARKPSLLQRWPCEDGALARGGSCFICRIIVEEAGQRLIHARLHTEGGLHQASSVLFRRKLDCRLSYMGFLLRFLSENQSRLRRSRLTCREHIHVRNLCAYDNRVDWGIEGFDMRMRSIRRSAPPTPMAPTYRRSLCGSGNGFRMRMQSIRRSAPPTPNGFNVWKTRCCCNTIWGRIRTPPTHPAREQSQHMTQTRVELKMRTAVSSIPGMDFVAWWEVRILEVALPKVGCGKCNGGAIP